VVLTTGATSCSKLQSNHHHQQTNIQFFYRPDTLPVTQPTVSKHWRENITFHGHCLPQAHLGVFQLCLWPLIAPDYLEGGLPCLSSALWCQYPNSVETWLNKKFISLESQSCWSEMFVVQQVPDRWYHSLSTVSTNRQMNPLHHNGLDDQLQHVHLQSTSLCNANRTQSDNQVIKYTHVQPDSRNYDVTKITFRTSLRTEIQSFRPQLLVNNNNNTTICKPP